MNNLLFRVFDKIKKSYLPTILNGFLVDTEDDKIVWQNIGELLKFEQYIGEQWTGLVDKNGTKIFLGDVLSCPCFDPNCPNCPNCKSLGEVVFYEGAYCLSVLRPYKLLGGVSNHTDRYFWKDAGIIGNMNENQFELGEEIVDKKKKRGKLKL